MNTIFSQAPGYGYRLALAAFLSVAFIVADMRFPQMSLVRQVLTYATTPVIWSINLPGWVSGSVGGLFTPRTTLQRENDSLRAQLLVLQRKTQQLNVLEAENRRFRKLVSASARVDEQLLGVELIGLDSDAFTHQIIINKGQADGVKVGMPLLDANGLMGQIIHIDSVTSRGILIVDANHAVPVEVNRNGVRAIAVGNGSLVEMELMFVPDTADIEVGDMLVTSGLGGKFPQGYPVAEVIRIEHDPGEHFAKVVVKPLAALNRSRHLLLVMNAAGSMAVTNE